MVKYCCCNSGVCPAMEDCMLTCAKDAINRQTIESNQKGCQSTWKDLLNIIVTSTKPGTLSFIIESKLCDLKWSQKDFLYLLYDEQLGDVFSTMEQQQLKKICMEHLPTKQLIQRAHNLMDQLIEEMMNKSLPCKLLKGIIDRKQHVNSYFLGKFCCA